MASVCAASIYPPRSDRKSACARHRRHAGSPGTGCRRPSRRASAAETAADSRGRARCSAPSRRPTAAANRRGSACGSADAEPGNPHRPGSAPRHASTVFVVSIRAPKPQSLMARTAVRVISSSSCGSRLRRTIVAEYQPNRTRPGLRERHRRLGVLPHRRARAR